MGDMSKEPSMEEILSSIKRIIAEEGEDALQAAPRRARTETAARAMPVEISVPSPETDLPEIDLDDDLGFDVETDEVLELTDEIAVEEPVAAPKSTRAAPAPAPTAPEPASILSVESEIAARQSLSALSSMLVGSKDGQDNTLDGLVRSMLRPMLKEWLDARLPSLVEEMVAKEIARITAS